MFVSARHLIHRKIHLSSDKNWELLTVPERQRYIRGERRELAFRVLSRIAAHGLLPYARHLFINLNKNFTPTNLQPFNHHFQCFDRIQELGIYWLDTPRFLESFDTYFANFVPTLHSLHLDTPIGDTRDILDFICRFPHLDDLTLKMSEGAPGDWRTWRSGTLPVVKSMPPFRGKLQLWGMTEWRGYLLQQLTSLPGKCRFRSIDFRNCEFEAEQPIVDACCGTLESVSTTWKKFGECRSILSHSNRSEGAIDEKGLPLNLAEATKLRSLTLRVAFDTIRYPCEVLYETLSTITSPFFTEFVLEVERVPTLLGPARDAWRWWGRWTELDEMFERMDIERGFKFVIWVEEMDRELNLISQAENRLPLMVARKGIVAKTEPFLDW